jgi:hypothetical protein
MKLKNVPTFPSHLFDWTITKNTGVSEASDLGVRAGGQIMSQIYDDACDFGCYVESSRTGRKVMFLFDDYDLHDDEIAGTRFTSECGQYKLLIIND